MRMFWSNRKVSNRFILIAGVCLLSGIGGPVLAQDLELPGEDLELPAEETPTGLPSAPADSLDFDLSEEDFEFEKSPEELKEEIRSEAFEAALQGLLPLNPDEIRTLLERYDRTQESFELPVYPAPKPELVVENLSLDPGAAPAKVKLAYGHVTTMTFVDSTGAPWPVHNISWAGNFTVVESENNPEKFTHTLKISPQTEFAFGNISIDLLGLQTPIIMTLETNRDTVHYRFDAIVPDYGPLAKAPLIASSMGGSGSAGNKDMSSALQGVFPQGAVRMNVTGTDGRTSAYRYHGKMYVRTPLTLLSPGWSSSASSADGTKVYEIEDAPVLLLSDRGQMIQAKISDREDILDE